MEIEQQKKNMQIPPDLIEEILLRLPVKSLVRFRSLSKQFLSLTTDPQFIKSNFDLGAAPTNVLLYTTHSGSEARWVDVDSSIRHCHNVRFPVPYHHKIIDSCRGFILLEKCWYEQCLILWNPLTGAQKKLSYSPAASMVKVYRSRCLWRGFGYDKSSDDYLIVVIWKKEYYFNDDDDFGTRWEFFSVKNNSWKEIAVAHSSDVDVSANKYGLFFNGSIHWLGTTRIIALDLAGKSVSKIKLPDLRGDYSFDLKQFGGCLGLCYCKELKTMIWVMKEYKGHVTWTKCYRIFHYGVIDPVCFTKRGELVAIKDQRYLAKFKDKERLVELHQDGHLRQDGSAVMFTPTLLSLPVDSGKTSKDAH